MLLGRERHRTHRDDMGGTGSFESNSRTLYVGGLRMPTDVDMKAIVNKHFAAFGEVRYTTEKKMRRFLVVMVMVMVEVDAEYVYAASAH